MEQDPKQKDTNTQKDTAKGHAGRLPLKVVCAEMDDLCHTAHGISKGLDLCESSVRAEISAVRRWAEAEVAAANARVDALEKMIEENRGGNLSAGVCASEDTGPGTSLAGY